MNLTALQHSPFLQSLGWAIANSLWQAAALWVAFYLINGTYRYGSARFKTNTSIILLSSAFVWFCFTFFDKYFSLQNKVDVDLAAQLIQPTTFTANSFANTQWQMILNKVATSLPYLSAAYLLLLIFLSVRLINSYRYINFIKQNGLQKPSVEWKLFTERVARHIGITKKIRLWVSHHIDVPATIGFLKPVILIPVASINQLSADQLEAIILHELSHIRRNDYLINIFISLVETILFFNPFIVLLAKIIKRERENCCDDFVIQYQYDRHSYASALLSLEQYRNVSMRFAISATSGKKQLLHRVKRIMEVKNNASFNYGQKLLALFLITGIICSVAWLSPSKEENKTVIGKKNEKLIEKSNAFKKSNATSLVKLAERNPDVTWINATVEKAAKASLLQSGIKNEGKKIKTLQDIKEKISSEDMVLQSLKLWPQMMQSPEAPPTFFKEPTAAGNRYLPDNSSKVLTIRDIQDMQRLAEQVDTKTYFDREHLQNNITNAWVNVQKTMPEVNNVFQSLKQEQIEQLINAELRNPNRKVFKRTVPVSRTRINIPIAKSISIADSFLSRNVVLINNRANRTAANKYLEATVGGSSSTEKRERKFTSPQPLQGYAYNYSGNTSPSGTAGAFGGSNLKPTTVYTTSGSNSVQFTNGTILLDGKVVKLAESNIERDKVVAKIKGKKLSIISGDSIVEIQLKD